MIGEIIANYELTAVLGAGSQATVYEARDLERGTLAAVKVLLPQIARDQPDRVSRFLDEARATQRLDDPGIVRVLDYGRDERSGCLYIVMERLAGVTLAQRIAERRCSLEEAIAIVYQLADALEAAHDHLDADDTHAPIVHRDLKPENIFLCAPDDRVKIVDFGIAKLAPSLRSSETLAGAALFGSPPYMAPEQFRGGRVDHRADLYALGCVFWELVTGAPPFGCDDVQRLMTAHGASDPGPLSMRAAVPPAVDRIVTRLLAKRPEDRFQTCAELKSALDDLDRGAGVTAPEPERSDPWILRQSAAGAWALTFFAGWALYGTSVAFGVGESFAKSLNWGPNYILIVPLIAAFITRTLRASNAAIEQLAARGMLVDDQDRAVAPDHPALHSTRVRLHRIPARTLAILLVTITISIAEWWERYENQPVAGEWWAASFPMGALGAVAQGVLVGGVLSFLIFLIPWAWFISELGTPHGELRLRACETEPDPRRGFEVLSPIIEGCIVLAVLLFVALYTSNVQSIAIDYGRAAGRSALSLVEVFEHGSLVDVGPLTTPSLTVILCCATIVSCCAVIVFQLHRVYWSTTNQAASLVAGVTPGRFLAASIVAMVGFIFYKLGIVVVTAVVVALLVGTRRARRGRVHHQ